MKSRCAAMGCAVGTIWILLGVWAEVMGADGILPGATTSAPVPVLPEPGFSLVCGGESIAGQSGWTNAASGLAVRRTMARYAEFDAVEWRLEIAHKGAQPSPVLERVQAGDFSLPVSSAEALTVHYSEGSHEGATDFQPLVASLPPGEARAFTPRDGRSSDGVMPYFNLARHGGGGWIVAAGWTGQWKAEFARSTNGAVRVRVGQERFHAALRPGESVRTPAVLVMTYAGDWVDGQNRFRRLMLGHFTPRPGGKPPELPIAASGATIGFNNFSESNQIAAVDHVVQKRLPVDTWWIDAGWMKGGFPAGQGNFEPDPARFPRGLRPVADRAHAGGLRFLLWFEPERVMPDTWLRGYRADWLLSPSALPDYGRYQEGWRLLDLGNPEALGWLKTNMSGLLRDWDVDVYRQDCNIHPAFYWRTGEAADRVGLNEAKYITGLYEFLDYLREQHPRLLIDNCASGGRRLDFEMMRRSVVLWRSDNCWQSEPDQCKTYGLSLWIPLQGLGSVSADPYAFRSGMGSCATYAFDFYSGEGTFWEPLVNLIREQLQVKHLFSGNFYPLTAYSTNQQDMIAWQFQSVDHVEGLVQAFRRPKCSAATAQLRLKGLNPESRYRVTDLNLRQAREVSGQELATKALTVTFPQAPFAVILTYTNLGTAKRP